MTKLDGLEVLAGVPEYKRRRVEARHALLQLRDQFIARGGFLKNKGTIDFCAAYNRLDTEASAELRALIPCVDARTLYRWEERFALKGMLGLCDGYGNRAGSGTIDGDPRLQNFILAQYESKPHITGVALWRALRAVDPQLAAKTSEKQITTWLSKWRTSNPQRALFLTNPDAAKSKYQAAFGDLRSSIIRLNQRWEIDSTKVDVILTDGRFTVIGIIEVWSARLLLLVTPTSKSVAVAALIRRALLEWGVPELLLSDNGSDYVSPYVKGAMDALGVTYRQVQKFSGDKKPFIERALGTLSHQLFELLPGYSGHSIAEQIAIRAQKSFSQRLGDQEDVIAAKIDSRELQRRCDAWAADTYAHQDHEGLGGKTPFAMAASWRESVRRIPEEKQRGLDVLLYSGATRTVGKKGVSIDSAWFVDPELAPLIGQQVIVKRDPTDIGKVVVLRPGPCGECDECRTQEPCARIFVCVATNVDRLGLGTHAELASIGRARQKEELAKARKTLRDAKAEFKIDDVQALMALRDAEAAKKITALPTSSAPHTTAEIDGAVVAADALAGIQAPPRSAPVTSLIQRIEAKAVDQELLDNNRAWNRFEAIEHAPDAQLSPEDAAWRRNFRKTGLYHSRIADRRDANASAQPSIRAVR